MFKKRFFLKCKLLSCFSKIIVYLTFFVKLINIFLFYMFTPTRRVTLRYC